MGSVYALQILERDTTTDKEVVVFEKPLPKVPTIPNWIPEDRADLELHINNLVGIPWHERDAMKASIFFLLTIQYPRHFYRITMADWKWKE